MQSLVGKFGHPVIGSSIDNQWIMQHGVKIKKKASLDKQQNNGRKLTSYTIITKREGDQNYLVTLSIFKSVQFYSFGPAFTSSLPAGLYVNLVKFLMNLAARSFALTSHWEAAAYVSRGSRIEASTPGSDVGTLKLK